MIGLHLLTVPFKLIKFLGVFLFEMTKIVIIFPYAPIISCYQFTKWMFLSVVGLFNTCKRFALGLRRLNEAANEVRSTTTSLQIIKDIAFKWGKSSVKGMFDGLKAVYNTIAYIGAEVGKHRYSILRYIYEKLLNFF